MAKKKPYCSIVETEKTEKFRILRKIWELLSTIYLFPITVWVARLYVYDLQLHCKYTNEETVILKSNYLPRVY